MDNTIETKLNRVDAAVSTIKQNLHFEDNALIEDVAASTDIKRLTNVFVQQNEPEIKDGIWVQCDEKENAFDKIIMDRNMIVPYKWQIPDVLTPFYIKSNANAVIASPNTVTVVGDTLFFFDKGYITYDLTSNTNIATERVDRNRLSSSTHNSSATDGTLIYFSYGSYGQMHIYDPVTNADSEVSITQAGDHYIAYSPFDNCVYVITSEGRYILRHNRNDNTTKQILSVKEYNGELRYVRLLALGQQLLVITNVPGESFVIDLANNDNISKTAYEGLSTIAVPRNTTSVAYGLLDMSDHFYIYNGQDEIIKYSKETLLGEDVTSLFYDPAISKLHSLFYYNNQFYGFVSVTGTAPVYLVPLAVQGKDYDCSAVIISQAPITRTEYQTALWTYEGLEGRMTQSFFDIFYYNKEKGYMKDYPIYYGNGTEWIRFKN